MPDGDDPWSFAQRFYAEPGVAEACLLLQDEAGADVCLLLHLLHLAATGRTVSSAAARELDDAVRSWREAVVRPLRSVRRELRTPPAGFAEATTLRRSLAAAEIEAERLELVFLGAIENSRPEDEKIQKLAAARTNLAAYQQCVGQTPEAAGRLLALFGRFVTESS